MKEELNKMLQQAMEEIEKAGDLEVIETLRVKYLGKKSKMSESSVTKIEGSWEKPQTV